jgi:hypothetical protein
MTGKAINSSGAKDVYPSHLKSWCLKYFEVIG